jgi:hypothetical protein
MWGRSFSSQAGANSGDKDDDLEGGFSDLEALPPPSRRPILRRRPPAVPALENAAYLVHDASRRRCLERGHVILHGIRGHRFLLCGFPGCHAGLSSLFKLLPSPPLAPVGLRGGMREGGVP